ncbi:hypothetical protein AAG570_001843 [Ranatra chinensis]|uniref:Uncharacterized protein n=1 Tax=Ranatra chinensis TaxID=642074 RepID=A0ABD0YW77_9HEMI
MTAISRNRFGPTNSKQETTDHASEADGLKRAQSCGRSAPANIGHRPSHLPGDPSPKKDSARRPEAGMVSADDPEQTEVRQNDRTCFGAWTPSSACVTVGDHSTTVTTVTESLRLKKASKRRNMYYQNKKQETTETGNVQFATLL